MSHENKASKWEISNAERISKLEKKLVEPTVEGQKVKIYIYSDINPDDIKKEIAELREQVKINSIDLVKVIKQITELKEFNKNHVENHMDWDEHKNDKININQEVLREIGEEIKAFRDDEGYGTYSIEKILAKLSGSGGEKLLVKKSLLGAVDSTPNSSLANSKPPELVEDFEYRLDLSEELKELEGEPREDEYLCKICTADIRSVIYKGNLYWMPKAEGYIPVKREDLQFLFNYIHSASSTPEEEKEINRIKEEYGIE